MEFARLETIWTGDDRQLQATADRADARLKESQARLSTATNMIRQEFGISADIIQRRTGDTATSVAQKVAQSSTAAVSSVSRTAQTASQQAQGGFRLTLDEFEKFTKLLGDKTAGQIIGEGRKLSAYSNALISESQRAISQAANVATGAENAIERVTGRLATAGSEVGALGGRLAALAAGPAGIATAAILAVTAAIAGITVVGFKASSFFSDYANSIGHLSEQTGITVGTLSALKVGVESAGGTIEQATTSVTQYLRRVSEAAHGHKEAARDFRQFGIDVKAAFSSPDEAVRLLLQRLAETSNASERLHIATKLAGEGGAILARVARESGGDLNKLRERAEELGQLLSDEGVRQAREFDKALNDLGLRAKGVAYQIGEEAMPAIEQGIEDVSRMLGTNKTSWHDWGTFIADEIASVRAHLVGLGAFMASGSFDVGVTAGQATLASSLNRGKTFNLMAPPQGRTPESEEELQRQIDLVSGRHRGGIGDKEDGSAESAARRLARQALEAAQIDLQQARRTAQELLEDEQRAFQQSKRALGEHTRNRIAAITDEYNKEKEVFDKQRREIASSPLESGEKNLRLRKLQEEEAAALSSFERRKRQFQEEEDQRRIEITRAHDEAELRLKQQQYERLNNLDKQSAERGLLTFEEAAQSRYNRLIETLGDEARIYEAQRERMNNDPEVRREVNDRIKAINDQQKAAQEQLGRDLAEARLADLDSSQRYAAALRSIYADVISVNQETLSIQLRGLEGNALRREELIRKEAALERAIESERLRDVEASLRDRIALIKKAVDEHITSEKDGAREIAAIDALILAEQKKSAAVRADIDRRAAEESRKVYREIASELTDVLFDAFGSIGKEGDSFLKSLERSALDVIKRIGRELLENGLLQILDPDQAKKGSGAGGIVGAATNAILKALGLGGKADPTKDAAQIANTSALSINNTALTTLTATEQALIAAIQQNTLAHAAGVGGAGGGIGGSLVHSLFSGLLSSFLGGGGSDIFTAYPWATSPTDISGLGTWIPQMASGGRIEKDGLAYLHKGEDVVPAHVTHTSRPSVYNFTTNITMQDKKGNFRQRGPSHDAMERVARELLRNRK